MKRYKNRKLIIPFLDKSNYIYEILKIIQIETNDNYNIQISDNEHIKAINDFTNFDKYICEMSSYLCIRAKNESILAFYDICSYSPIIATEVYPILLYTNLYSNNGKQKNATELNEHIRLVLNDPNIPNSIVMIYLRYIELIKDHYV